MASTHLIDAPRPRGWRSSRLALDVLPVAAIVLVGALTIAFTTGGNPRGSHPFWLGAVLAENALALLARRRHPIGALAGVLAAYVLFDALAVSLLPIALALGTVAATCSRRVVAASSAIVAAAVGAVPLLHGDRLDAVHVLLRLAATALAVAVGRSLRMRAGSDVRPMPAPEHASTFVA